MPSAEQNGTGNHESVDDASHTSTSPKKSRWETMEDEEEDSLESRPKKRKRARVEQVRSEVEAPRRESPGRWSAAAEEGTEERARRSATPEPERYQGGLSPSPGAGSARTPVSPRPMRRPQLGNAFAGPPLSSCRSVDFYEKLNRIEEGAYGIVYRARDRRTGEIVALKKLKLDKEKNGFPVTSLREIQTLLLSKHPNIVNVKEITVGESLTRWVILRRNSIFVLATNWKSTNTASSLSWSSWSMI
jgi:cell division cycle 2-like protein